MATGTFQEVEQKATTKQGVKEITYDQFMDIRNSGEDYVLLDVLKKESYQEGHIPGAKSFPVTEMNQESVKERLSKSDKIIVYCGGFSCPASTNAAKVLTSLGYDVLDFKGGIEKWKKEGNQLEQ